MVGCMLGRVWKMGGVFFKGGSNIFTGEKDAWIKKRLIEGQGWYIESAVGVELIPVLGPSVWSPKVVQAKKPW